MIVCGMMSGTSADGVDTVLMDLSGAPPALNWKLQVHEYIPYPATLRQRVLDCTAASTSNVKLVCELNVELGRFYANCVNAISKNAAGDLGCIGCHGQTVWHIPSSATLQIGEPAIIAEQTGTPVVSNFRARDIAAGGQGAPLVAYVDLLLFSHPTRTRALQNLGGIGNVTWLPNATQRGQGHQAIAFDTGPANMLLDEMARFASNGALNCDIQGTMAARGRVHGALLEELLTHPFFAQKPPKTTGREVFGRPLAEQIWQEARAKNLLPEDIMATLTLLTAACIADAYRDFLPTLPDEVFLSGGGARNPSVVRALTNCLYEIQPRIRIANSDELGLPVDAKEAACFAILAYETWHRRPGNLPSATGARHEVILGDITF